MELKRRSVLSKAATMGGIAIGQNSIKSTDGPNKARFIETGVKYEPKSGNISSDMTTYHKCVDKPYRMYEDTLYVDRSSIDGSEKKIVEKESIIIFSDGFKSEGSPIFDTQDKTTLPTKISPDHQSSEGVILNKAVKRPEVKVATPTASSVDPGSIEIVSGSSRDIVEPGYRTVHQLGPVVTEVETRQRNPASKDKSGQPSWSRGNKPMEARPEIVTKNYGHVPVDWMENLTL